MRNIIYIIFTCVFYVSAPVFLADAQTYYKIPDVNLRNKLVKDYPTLMRPTDSLLDVTAAKAMSADLVLDAVEIADADGIQFFESTGILKIRNNKLTALPQLSSMKNLRRIYINGNKISSIPDLSALYQLIDLFVGNNKIASMAGSNFEKRTTLLFFNCAGNDITSLPDLSALTNLQTLSVGFNPISALPDLSTNINIQQLEVNSTNISSVPYLPILTNLKIFICDKSKIIDLSGLNSNTTLTTLKATNNNLTTLPNFSNKPGLISVDISNNALTFEDIVPLSALATFSAFIYAPQKALSIPAKVTIRESNNYTYQVSIDPSISSNQYNWKKNTISLITSPSSSFSFTPVFMSDSGSYSVSVTNPAAPLLEIKSNVSTLTVKSCLEITDLRTTTLSSDCREGSKIDFDGTIVEGALEPIHYNLQNINTTKKIPNSSTTQFYNVIPGSYVVTITDTKNCTVKQTFVFDDAIDCDQAFTPNGDGIMDNYFIAGSGTAQIYNTSKKLIKTINLPGVWDGTSNEGKLVDAGYYVIIINESTSIDISLMR